MASFTLLMAGCESDDFNYMPPAGRSSFMLYIHLPEQPATTKAEIFADDEEKVISSLQVWVFALDENKAPKDIEETGATSKKSLYVSVPADKIATSGGVVEVAFDVSEDFATYYPYLDAYAIVNAGSLGLTLGESAEKADLEALQFTNDHFGIVDSSPAAVSVPATGLPMSGCIKEAAVSKKGEVFTIANMDVTRAVSKIRFVFTKAEDVQVATVQSIKLNGYRVFSDGRWENRNEPFMPSSQYLFSGLTHEIGGNQVQTDYSPDYLSVTDVNFNVPVDVKSHPNPWLLRWDNEETAQEWEDKVNEAIASGKAVESGRAYLHETPRCIIGEISYTVQINGQSNSDAARFSMNAENGFLRNHSWTILAFFSEGGVMVEVADWDKQDVDLKPFK